jgi:serine/threonine protein kinase
MSFKFPQFVPTPLAQVIPNASPEALSLIQDLMKFDPQQRPTAAQTLQYPFFQMNSSMPPLESSYNTPAPTFTRRPVAKSDAELREEQLEAERLAELALEEGQVFIPPMISGMIISRFGIISFYIFTPLIFFKYRSTSRRRQPLGYEYNFCQKAYGWRASSWSSVQRASQ